MARQERQSRPAVANAHGVVHMHIDGSMPEAAELQSLLEAQRGKNTDHDANEVFNPAVSTKQRQLMAIAEHAPSKVHKANRGVLKMSKSQLHDFASTKGL
jgi:hypothetical protein